LGSPPYTRQALFGRVAAPQRLRGPALIEPNPPRPRARRVLFGQRQEERSTKARKDASDHPHPCRTRVRAGARSRGRPATCRKLLLRGLVAKRGRAMARKNASLHARPWRAGDRATRGLSRRWTACPRRANSGPTRWTACRSRANTGPAPGALAARNGLAHPGNHAPRPPLRAKEFSV